MKLKNKIFDYIIITILMIFNIFTVNKINLFINIFLMFLEYILIYFLIFKNNSKRDNICLILFSFLFSFYQIIGYNCSIYDMTKLNKLTTYINILNLIPIISSISNILYNINFPKINNENKIINILFNQKYSFFLLAFIIFIAWLPILISFYPGNFSYDAGTQLRMLNFNLVTKYHPVIHTVFLYITIIVGKIFFSYETGLLIHSIIQMLIMSFIFSYTLIYLYKNNFPNKINIIFLFMYMFLPIHSMFSITTTKDIIFSGLFNLAVIKLINLSLNTEEFYQKKSNIISFIIIFVLLLAFRNNMIYAFILLIPFIFIILRKYLKKILLLFISVVFIFIVYDLTLTKVFKIPNGPKVEAFSFVVQQLARVYNIEELSIEEKQNVEKLYNNDSLSKYNSHISDPVKSEFNTTELMSNFKENLSLYLNLGTKYPMTYIDSIFTNNYSFFYLFDKLPDPNSKTFIEISCLDLSNNTYERTNVCNKNVEPIYNLYYDLLNNANYQNVPILNIVMNMPLYVMILLFITIYLIAKKKYKLLIPILLLVCYVFTNLIAPVAIVRYMYPLFTCIPLIIYLFYKAKN